jgi:crotonobetainyl-CoA:carnitine CoA-transferase CaiB-like acyl-CoA transferase
MPMKLASAGCMSDDSSTGVSDTRMAAELTSGGVVSEVSDVERARQAPPPPIADLATSAAGSVGAALAFAAVHDDGDVRVVLVALDKAGPQLFAELGRDD